LCASVDMTVPDVVSPVPADGELVSDELTGSSPFLVPPAALGRATSTALADKGNAHRSAPVSLPKQGAPTSTSPHYMT
jgi:hypothetical protein